MFILEDFLKLCIVFINSRNGIWTENSTIISLGILDLKVVLGAATSQNSWISAANEIPWVEECYVPLNC
ncbi:unnamed protein product [Coffea canephora]|uniref:Uncharacterized protein n=1 Tax=Coffea canephora TaxID=49390 RepID=A0A068V8N5_COFCA|nr:unnamed protein product [Coffea canephora]